MPLRYSHEFKNSGAVPREFVVAGVPNSKVLMAMSNVTIEGEFRLLIGSIEV